MLLHRRLGRVQPMHGLQEISQTIARSDPTKHAGGLQVLANCIGDFFVFAGVADEDLVNHCQEFCSYSACKLRASGRTKTRLRKAYVAARFCGATNDKPGPRQSVAAAGLGALDVANQ